MVPFQKNIKIHVHKVITLFEKNQVFNMYRKTLGQV